MMLDDIVLMALIRGLRQTKSTLTIFRFCFISFVRFRASQMSRSSQGGTCAALCNYTFRTCASHVSWHSTKRYAACVVIHTSIKIQREKWNSFAFEHDFLVVIASGFQFTEPIERIIATSSLSINTPLLLFEHSRASVIVFVFRESYTSLCFSSSLFIVCASWHRFIDVVRLRRRWYDQKKVQNHLRKWLTSLSHSLLPRFQP